MRIGFDEQSILRTNPKEFLYESLDRQKEFLRFIPIYLFNHPDYQYKYIDKFTEFRKQFEVREALGLL